MSSNTSLNTSLNNSSKSVGNLGNAVNQHMNALNSSSTLNKNSSISTLANSAGMNSNAGMKTNSAGMNSNAGMKTNSAGMNSNAEMKNVSITGNNSVEAIKNANASSLPSSNTSNMNKTPGMNNLRQNNNNTIGVGVGVGVGNSNSNKKKINNKNKTRTNNASLNNSALKNNASLKNASLTNKSLTLKNNNNLPFDIGETNSNNANATLEKDLGEDLGEDLGADLGEDLGAELGEKTVEPANTSNDITKVEGIIQSNTNNLNKNANTVKRISLNRLCMNMISHQVVMKLFHFQTQLYGAHKASDGYLNKYAETMDKFLEVAQGIYGKITLKKYALTGSSHNDENIVKHLDGMITYWKLKIDDVLNGYTDLINIRDELIADADQLKYLLSFK